MVKVLCLEDDPYCWGIADFLGERGYQVEITPSLSQLTYLLECKYGINTFDYLLFDISLPRETIQHKDGRVVCYDSPLPGIEYLINNRDLFLPKALDGKVAIVTGHPNFSTELDYEFLRLIPVIGKADDDFLRQLTNFLRC